MKLVALLVALSACGDSIPAGAEPITVYVVDVATNASLCNASVTINGSAMSPGGGGQDGCYFVPTFAMSEGEAYTLSVSDDGYAPQSESGTIDPGGSSVVVQLAKQ